jgi:3D (Asp-Asp-Asp) domain-containing protein
MRKQLALALALAMFAACKAPVPESTVSLPRKTPAPRADAPARSTELRGEQFTATAYALEGITASGTRARRGIVAADPRVIPLGSRIRVLDAGKYSGEYLVEDTGSAIKGKIIDIKVGSYAEARKFGRQRVRVEVLERPGTFEASAK